MLNPRPWAFDSRPLSMLSVALTGNIGAGKSTVAELFRSWGATIIDSDQLVREAGLAYACTVRQGNAPIGGDPFRLPRYEVLDWPGDQFESHLLAWLGLPGASRRGA